MVHLNFDLNLKQLLKVLVLSIDGPECLNGAVNMNQDAEGKI